MKIKKFSDIDFDDEKYKRMEYNSRNITDGLGKKIDSGIRELVVLLNYNGIITTQSCWGHKEYGLPYPWIYVDGKSTDKLEQLIKGFDLGIVDEEGFSRLIPIKQDSWDVLSLNSGRLEFNKLKDYLSDNLQ